MIPYCGVQHYQDLSAESYRLANQSGRQGTYTVNTGIYLLLAQTSAQNFNGRALAWFSTDEAVDKGRISALGAFMPPTITTQYYDSHVVQLCIAKVDNFVINKMYYDSATTGPAHNWQIWQI